MKLRTLGNSIRLRLSQTEVQLVYEHGIVSETVTFPGGARFTYRLVADPDARRPSAGFGNDELAVTLPRDTVNHWATSDEVSIRASEDLPGGEALALLIEKDFACLKPREDEDESDLYPHPEAADA